MSGYTLSPKSTSDLFEIWTFLARTVDENFAHRVDADLFKAFELVARHPGIGHRRQDLTSLPVLFYRALPHQYLIIYRQQDTDIEISRVLHGKRDVKKLLKT